MTTDAGLGAYVRLRELDESLHGLERVLAAMGETTRRETVAFALAEAEAHGVEESMKAIKAQERAVELELRSIDEQIHKLEEAAQSSSSSQIFAMTEKALAKKRAEREAAEDAGLELLDRLDFTAAKLKEAQAAAKGREAALNASKAAMAREEPLIRARVAETEKQVRELLGTLPDGFGQRYWEAAESPGRPVFARVKDDGCSACGLDLSASILSKAGHGTPESCPGCQRLLLNA